MSKIINPTKKQRELLNYVERFSKRFGYSPSYREIAEGLGYASIASVAQHVDNLIKRGHIKKRSKAARSIEIVKHGG